MLLERQPEEKKKGRKRKKRDKIGTKSWDTFHKFIVGQNELAPPRWRAEVWRLSQSLQLGVPQENKRALSSESEGQKHEFLGRQISFVEPWTG